ncbi:hypothetical protein ACFYUV_49880 [Nonomuraea sp. NPDC003560]|uniref:hypothetical protein n=1 Tax=Nonomuraea sp. NPDC003560 TaxID=3364341 RepID=UPI0036CAF8E9
MARKSVLVGIAALAIAVATSATPAQAAASTLGCTAGDVCMYSTYPPVSSYKIGIGRGEDWKAGEPYYYVRSVFNNGTYDGSGEYQAKVWFHWWDSNGKFQRTYVCTKIGDKKRVDSNGIVAVDEIDWMASCS